MFTKPKPQPLYSIFIFALLFLAYATPHQQQLIHSFIHQKQIAHHHHGELVHTDSEHSESSQKQSDSSHKHSFRTVSFVLPISAIKACFHFPAVMVSVILKNEVMHPLGFDTIGFFSQAPPVFAVSKIFFFLPPNQAPPLA